jgi:predicted glycoside hydrolase/deacetylase ChbG (UPF0249 family)
MDRGVVTSATIVAAGDALDDVARRCRDYPHCSFGTHLFLDEFQPLTDLSAFGDLLLPDGRLKEDARTYAFTRSVRIALLEEWVAQVERLRSLGIPVSHLDSHHHVHTIPALFGMLKALQRRTGVRKVRISLNCYAQTVPRMTMAKKRLFNFALRRYVPTTTTTHFASFEIFHALLEQGRLPRPSTIELMVHPAASTYMKAPAQYEDELVKLAGGWRDRLPWDHCFISYNDL